MHTSCIVHKSIHGDKEQGSIKYAMGNATLLKHTNWIVHCSVECDKKMCMCFKLPWQNLTSLILTPCIFHYSISGDKKNV